MSERRLHSKAWIVLGLQALYHAAEGMCAIFVAVYLWINSHDFDVVCRHYLALYCVIPFVFILAGWYSQARDRLHVYRFGLLVHAVYYATLLTLRERAPEFAVPLGALLGVAWGTFWAGTHTLNFDVTIQGQREYYFGILQSIAGASRLVAPLIGAAVIGFSPDRLQGYHTIFVIVVIIYLFAIALSFRMTTDNKPRPFRLRRALFPGKDQRDWRLVMMASTTLAGAFVIFAFLLGLIMFMETDSELAVGGFASFQALAGIIAAYTLGRIIKPKNRRTFMFWGTVLLVGAGTLIAFKLTLLTLCLFGFLRAIAGQMFAISHFSLRLDVIEESVEESAQRIEYLCAWEVPLAIGRITMILTLMGLYGWLTENGLGLRLFLFILCSLRILTFLLITRTSMIRRYAEG